MYSITKLHLNFEIILLHNKQTTTLPQYLNSRPCEVLYSKRKVWNCTLVSQPAINDHVVLLKTTSFKQVYEGHILSLSKNLTKCLCVSGETQTSYGGQQQESKKRTGTAIMSLYKHTTEVSLWSTLSRLTLLPKSERYNTSIFLPAVTEFTNWKITAFN